MISLLNSWQTEAIYSDPEQYYRTLVNDINSAQHSIDLAVYIFLVDEVGTDVLSALSAAASRGVKIRLLIDGFGSAQHAAKIALTLCELGAAVQIYHPLPWGISNFRWSRYSGNWIGKVFYFSARVNRRDHRKFCVIDNTVGWCGSFNICIDHLGKTTPWRDYGTRITGTPISFLTRAFDHVWRRQKIRPSLPELQLFRTNSSLRLRLLRNNLLAKDIRHAKHRVWICNAYFAPSGKLLRAIRAARRRGVEVRLIMAGKSDVAVFPMLSATYYADLLKAGVQIYSYQRGMLHAKVMLIDNQCLIGSTNLNHRSLYHDLELDVILNTPDSIDQIQQLLRQDIEDSLPISASQLSPWQSTIWFGWLLRIIRYWM